MFFTMKKYSGLDTGVLANINLDDPCSGVRCFLDAATPFKRLEEGEI